jgi:hypothetical protein
MTCDPVAWYYILAMMLGGGVMAALAAEGVISLEREHRQRREIKDLTFARKQAT